jgi:hypothetical protein
MMTLENAATGEHCPNCNSEHTIYDSDHGFWQCEECSNVWAYDEDDPDYEEIEDLPTIEEMAGILADEKPENKVEPELPSVLRQICSTSCLALPNALGIAICKVPRQFNRNGSSVAPSEK